MIKAGLPHIPPLDHHEPGYFVHVPGGVASVAHFIQGIGAMAVAVVATEVVLQKKMHTFENMLSTITLQ